MFSKQLFQLGVGKSSGERNGEYRGGIQADVIDPCEHLEAL